MAYELNWHMPGKVLYLVLSGHYTHDEAEKVNQLIHDELDKNQTSLNIFIDVTRMQKPHNFATIRNAQTFINHPRLHCIFVIAEDRLMRLSMMVIFNLAQAQLYLCDQLETAERMLDTLN